MKESKAVLVLEDGTIITGDGLGTGAEVFGEVVFNTSMSGYEEAFTDPSYAGQILLMTYPLIGNYGFYNKCRESRKPQVRGLVLKQPLLASNHGRSLLQFLEEARIPCLYNIDTRALTVKIREFGTMKAILTTSPDPDIEKLLLKVRARPHPDTDNLVQHVTCSEVIIHPPLHSKKRRILLIDCGVKKSIVDNLKKYSQVIQAPYHISYDRIEEFRPSGIVISNGPGDPAHPEIEKTVVLTLKKLIGKYPIFGICLGHQILGLSLGFQSYKLRFGHRGANHAVKDLQTGRIFITTQNHGYALRENGAAAEASVGWLNVNDKTVEGIRHKSLPVFSVQFHPEGGPGPYDTSFLFKNFMEMLS